MHALSKEQRMALIQEVFNGITLPSQEGSSVTIFSGCAALVTAVKYLCSQHTGLYPRTQALGQYLKHPYVLLYTSSYTGVKLFY